MYSELLFIFGRLQTVCAASWPTENFHPWAAIWLADFLRGTLPVEEFKRLFSMVNSDYLPLAQCIIENTPI